MNTPFNSRALYGSNVRQSFSGKDCVIFNGEGELLSTIESFSAEVNFNTADYQVLGSAIQQAFLTGYSINISITNIIVESEEFLRGSVDFFNHGRHAPSWVLQAVVNGYDGSEERIIFRDCVPAGTWNLHNFSTGDLIKRTLSLRANVAPELQKLLSYGE